MPIRASAVDGTATYSALANGVTWAANHGARVGNISCMVTNSSTVTSAASYISLTHNIQWAVTRSDSSKLRGTTA